MKIKKLNLNQLDAIIFDFDGVLTNNRVLIDQNGVEQVYCHRGDGLAFDVFRKLGKNVFIFSTEKNSVVSARAKKLKIPVIQNVSDKLDTLTKFSLSNELNLSRVLYVGNDLNDYYVMQACGISVCPADSHPKIKEIATYQLKTKGGEGVVRELIEELLEVDMLEVLYSK